MTLRASAGPLHDVHDLLLLDLDGVVYTGARAVPGAVTALEAATLAGARCCYTTNNASRPPADVAAHLRELGVPCRPEQVLTSSQAAAALVVDRVGRGARVLAVGGAGVGVALEEVGLVPVDRADDDPVAVVQGFGAEVGWPELTEAAHAVRAGVLWVATNTDVTLPTERGPAPGNGALVAAVRAATGAEPLVAGKPQPSLFSTAVSRAGGTHPLAVGDRLDTDVAAAVAAGVPSLLVLTGVSGPLDLLAAGPAERPHHVAANLAGLGERHVAPESERGTGGWRCRGAVVVVRDHVVVADPLDPRDSADQLDPLDLLRAACAAAWAAADAGSTTEVHPLLAQALEAARPGHRSGR